MSNQHETDLDTLAGIVAATDDDAMPRVVDEFTFAGYRVSIVEPTLGGDDEISRGYLWHAVIGEFDLVPTRPGLYDDTRWVPGCARLRAETGAELVSYSSKSAKAAAKSARRILSRRAGLSS